MQLLSFDVSAHVRSEAATAVTRSTNLVSSSPAPGARGINHGFDHGKFLVGGVPRVMMVTRIVAEAHGQISKEDGV